MKEVFIKDLEFNKLEDNALLSFLKEASNIRHSQKRRSILIILIEILLLVVLTIIDPMVNKLVIPIGILCCLLTIQYFIWMIKKMKKIIQHFDIDYFFKSAVNNEIEYLEVKCDLVNTISKKDVEAIVSTLSGDNIMNRIKFPVIEDKSKYGKKNNPNLFLIRSKDSYFAVESLELDWWQRNITKM